MFKLAVLALVLALSTAAHSRADTHAVLTEVDQSSFGHSILSAIQTHLATSSAEDEINMLLNEILASLNDSQRDHDALQRTASAVCGRILVDLDNNVQYHDAQRVSNTLLRDDTVEALAGSEDDLRQTVKDIEDNESLQSREQNTRDGQQAVWEHKDAQHDEALQAVDDGSKMIQHLQLGASFAQLKSKYDVVLKKLETVQVQQALFKPIIAALVELSTSVDFKAVQKIAELLAQLRQQLVESRLALRDTNEKQASHWAEFSAHLSNEHNRLVDRKSQLEAQIGEQKDTIADAQEFIEYHDFEFDDNTEGLAHQEAWCEEQEEAYENMSNERTTQGDLVQRIQEHISEHIAGVAQFLGGRKVQG